MQKSLKRYLRILSPTAFKMWSLPTPPLHPPLTEFCSFCLQRAASERAGGAVAEREHRQQALIFAVQALACGTLAARNGKRCGRRGHCRVEGGQLKKNPKSGMIWKSPNMKWSEKARTRGFGKNGFETGMIRKNWTRKKPEWPGKAEIRLIPEKNRKTWTQNPELSENRNNPALRG